MADTGSDFVVRPPAPPLRDFIDSYAGYREVGLPVGDPPRPPRPGT